eukprot:9169117-Alexandrium_andersonii.AAC.1
MGHPGPPGGQGQTVHVLAHDEAQTAQVLLPSVDHVRENTACPQGCVRNGIAVLTVDRLGILNAGVLAREPCEDGVDAGNAN